jgi:hypothetical protein
MWSGKKRYLLLLSCKFSASFAVYRGILRYACSTSEEDNMLANRFAHYFVANLSPPLYTFPARPLKLLI